MSGPPLQMDLTGKLIIKMQLGEDIRRIQMINDDLTYDELVIMMQRVFRGQLEAKDEVSLKYKDEDGDLITISDSTDLTFAIQCSRILRIVLFVNGKPRPLEGDDVKHIRAELQTIRNHVNALLDSLEPPAPAAAETLTNGDLDSDVAMVTVAHSPAGPGRPGAGGHHAAAPAPLGDSKEFDPLSQQKHQPPPEPEAQNKVMSAFGISNEAAAQRPASPAGSNSSIGSSTSNRPQQPNALPGQPPQQQFQPPQQPGYPGYQQQAQQQQAQQQRQMHPGQPPYPQQPGYPTASGADAAAPQQPFQQQYTAPGQQVAPGQAPGQPGAYPQPPSSQYPGQQYQQQQYNQSGAGAGGMPGAYGGYAQPGHPGAGAPTGPPTSAAGSANPYSGGRSYGQYPRAQGQYPQSYTQPQ